MSTIQSIVRILFILLAAASLLGISSIPVQAQGTLPPAGLSPADWTQIKALMPPATIDAQQAYVKASNTGAGDNFGSVIAIDGDTLVVGAHYESSNATRVDGDQGNDLAPGSGAVYIFTRNGSTWSQQAYLKSSNTDIDDHFGNSVAIDGDTLVVGAYGESSNATGVDGNQADNSAVNAGAVYVFTRSGSIWSQQAYIKASNAGANDYFGGTVAISGDTMAVGAAGEASNATGLNGNQADDSAVDSGAVYVFTRSGSVWSQQAYIKASNADAGDYFGGAIAIAGDTVVIGATGESSNATGPNGNQADNSVANAGAAYVFIRFGSNWSQQAYLKGASTWTNYHFGWSAAISGDGDTLAVGARDEGLSGAAYVFTRSGSTWSQQAYLNASNGGLDDGFGNSVAIFGDTLVVGAYGESSNATGVNGDQTDNNASGSGAAYVFTRNGSTWGQQAYLKASNTNVMDAFGNSVAISGDTLVMGAPYEASNAIGVNGDQADNSATYSGAAYVLILPPLIVSSLPADANPTSAASVNFTLTFSEPMTGVEASDLMLTTTGGMTSASITNVSGGPTAYTVSVATGPGDGTIRLDVLDDDTILSVAASTPLGGTGTGNGDFASGQVYTIDRTPPTVTAISVVLPGPFDTGTIAHFTVNFWDDVTGVDITDFHLTTSGVTGAEITDVSGSGDEYTVTIATGLHIGTIRLDLVDDDSIMDAASNRLGGVGAGNGNFNGKTYFADRTFTVTISSTLLQDGWVLESSENSNKGGTMNAAAKTIQLGDDALNRQYRVILSFNTAPLPNNAIIKAVVLNISQSGAPVGGNPFSTLGSLWADIRKGSFGSSALQLADFNALASANKVGYVKKTFAGYNASLNALGRSNINKLGLTQFRLYFAKDDNNNRKADFMRFVAHYTLGSVPNLTITYSVP